MPDFHAALEAARARVDAALQTRLPDEDDTPSRLHAAMRYAVMGGGKRVRPLLVYASGEAVGLSAEQLDAPACAVELIHAYSLVHDDLPAMDDDALRRGRPTCHIAFDEASAILAGDALQALAFEVLAEDRQLAVSPRRRLQMIRTLARASGAQGMAGGQAIDLAAVGRTLSLEQLEHMHRLKTGALIRASIRLGALAREDCEAATLERLDRYAAAIGLAFQVQDDILDVTADTETLGKTQGADQASGKPTFVSLLGLEGARAHARALYEDAHDQLAPFDQRADTLRQIARFIIERGH